jgi:REP element-mobilizing transposase RayT
MKPYYHRNLPHYQPEGAEFHVVFRLAGSLPIEFVKSLQRENETAQRRIASIRDPKERQESLRDQQARHFAQFDSMLDQAETGPRWLVEPAVADLVAEGLHKPDKSRYDLFAFTIMSNHVHVVFEHLPVERDSSRSEKERAKARGTTSEYVVTDIFRLIKGSTAYESNKILHRTGAFWQHESYDHVTRDDQELERTIWYVLYNPVKAHLVDDWKLWKWTYVKEGLIE